MNIFISREESAAIKGLLIFFIVLGHNFIFAECFGGSHGYWYTFNVACFFILSFFYPAKKLTKERLINNFVRMYCPYICFFLTLFVINFLCTSRGIVLSQNEQIGSMTISGFFVALVNGGVDWLPTYIVFQYLWFLPAMFAFTILKEILLGGGNFLKIILLTLGGGAYVFLYVFMYHAPYPMTVNKTIEAFSLFAVFQGLAFVFLSYITHKASYYFQNVWIASILFLLFTYLYFNHNSRELVWCMRAIMPIITFIILLGFKEHIAKSKILRTCGIYSLQIYLVQTPICAVVYTIAKRYLPMDSIAVALSSQVLIFVLSCLIGFLLTKIPITNRLLFPRSLSDLVKK